MNTSQKLKQLVLAGHTQSSIAAKAGVSQATISRILSGKQTPLEPLVIAIDRVFPYVSSPADDCRHDRRAGDQPEPQERAA